ncbi:MAG: ACP S-malonyltransferase [Nitrospiraceae bacterium]|jgi:[acyl-carrier-protein] S-malonyltransferase|nr:ACP S-malonyltransferase [Nitrospirota bacterium]MDA8339092.1 ACP S-malonyltransferase [Nitrospiraceae bacterium]
MKIAFVFPGQGSQSVGMGKDLYDNLDEVKSLYYEASEILGYDVAVLSFSGPADELNKTYRTQPCLLVASIAAYKALTLKNIKPSAVVGHSLGEYSALVAAGSISFKDAVKITEIRGRIMQDAVPEGKGLMAAILGLDRKIVDEICSRIAGYVSAANYNCPGQIVISGEKAAVEEAMNLAKERGAKRALPLAVSVPSHCKLMEDAGKKFEEALKEVDIRDALVPFVNNVEAKFVSNAEDIRKSLVLQLSRSVLWEDCIKTISSSGISTFIEVGPGKVLSGLVKRIEPAAKIFNVENMESLNKTLSDISGA